MGVTLTASKVLAFRAEIERHLGLLREEAREQARQEPYEQGKSSSQQAAVVDANSCSAKRAFNVVNINRHVDEIRACVAALRRIEDGSFGICTECGEDIELNRLKANPVAACCIRCQSNSSILQAAG